MDNLRRCPICGQAGYFMRLPDDRPADYTGLMLHKPFRDEPRRVCKLKQGQLPLELTPRPLHDALDVAELIEHAHAAGLNVVVFTDEETTE